MRWWVIGDVCIISRVARIPILYSETERNGWRDAFFSFRPSQLDESSSIVSFRFDSPQLVAKVFVSIIYLSQGWGGRNLGPHYHRHDTSSAESTFANLLPPREEEERATKLRALCLWFHNFRRRDVRRPESIGRGRRDQNLMRSIEDEFRRRPHLYKRGMDREMDELWRRLGNASCRIEPISIRLSQIVTMEMNLEKWKRRITRLRIISTIMLMSIPLSKNIQFDIDLEDPFNLELISRPTSDRILSIFLHVRAINNENNYRRINQRGITTFVGQRDFNDSRWKKAEHQSPPKRTTLPLTYRCY